MFLGMGVDQFPDKFKGKYDVVTGTGVFLPKHIPCAAFEDAHAALKLGGHFIFTMRANLWVDGQAEGYKDKIEEMIAAGKFELLQDKTKDFIRGKDGIDPLFAKQPSKIFVCKKIA